MSPDWVTLPPPASQPRHDPWEHHLTTLPAVTGSLNLYRFGAYHYHGHHETQRPVPVPHPQNKYYTSIEMAKRKQVREETWWKRKQQENHRNDINHQRWIKPMSESEFQIHRPNIRNWNRVFRVRMPGGY